MELVRTVSMSATRHHPWERWAEPVQEVKHALYFGVVVQVVKELNYCTLIRRPDGMSCIVETADLVEVRG